MLLADINNKLLKQVFNFHSTFLETIFGEENTDNDFTDEEMGKRKVSGPLAQKIKTLMQVNRLHKKISARFCEFIFILRKLFKLSI